MYVLFPAFSDLSFEIICLMSDAILFQRLKYHTQVTVRSTRGKNARGRKISGIEPMPGEDKVSYSYKCIKCMNLTRNIFRLNSEKFRTFLGNISDRYKTIYAIYFALLIIGNVITVEHNCLKNCYLGLLAHFSSMQNVFRAMLLGD